MMTADSMQVMPDESQAPASITEIKQIIDSGTNPYDLTGWSREQKLAWIGSVLKNCQYDLLPRADKGVVKAYLQQATGYSRAQTTRFIAENRRESIELPDHQAATMAALNDLLAVQAQAEASLADEITDNAVDMYAEVEAEETFEELIPEPEVETAAPVVARSPFKWNQLEWLTSSALVVTAVWALVSIGAVDHALKGMGAHHLVAFFKTTSDLPPQLVQTGSDKTDAAADLMRACLQADSSSCDALAALQIPVSDPTTADDLKHILGQVIQVKGSLVSLVDDRVTGTFAPLTDQRLAAQARLPAGEEEVQVNFERVFLGKPVVTASPSEPLPYAVSNVSEQGFTITVSEPNLTDVYFSWVALIE